MRILYIADLHLGHNNIIKHCNRPFKDADEMDAVLIQNWNNTVRNDDEVYILGDVCYTKGSISTIDYLKKLNGRKYIIIGNHDYDIIHNRKGNQYPEAIGVFNYLEVKDNGRKVVMSHYPMVEWNGFFRGSIHLFGHIHNNQENNTYKIISKLENAYNVGADILDFTPRTLDEVIEYNKKFKGV